MTWAVLGVTRGLLGVTGDDITGFMYIQVIRQAGGHLSRFAEFFLIYFDILIKHNSKSHLGIEKVALNLIGNIGSSFIRSCG